MSATTSQERRRRTVTRLIIIGSLLGFLLLLALDEDARARALDIVGLLEQLRDARGAAATIAVIVVIMFAIIENAEKLHFIWEMGHKLLGYDLESMARHEREFTDLPDDYVRRPAVERELVAELAPGREPKLVVLTGEHDSGKTTMLNYVIPRQLNRPFHGNIIYCRGDLQSIEGGIGENEDQLRRRLTKRVLRRVIQHAEVPGDIGETSQSMSTSIAEHFARERKRPWLIIIDQIDSPNFPYVDTLPALFGQCNTVVVVVNHAEISERAYTITDEDGEQALARRDVHLQPFSPDESLAMFRQEVRKRHGALSLVAASALKSRLGGAWPGTVQRLSDIYVNGGGIPGIERALDPTVRGVQRTKAIATTIVDQFPAELKHFVAGLALFAGESVGEEALLTLATTRHCQTMSFSTFLEECRRRQYLKPTSSGPGTAPKRAVWHRYTITKLGRGIASITLRGVGRDAELQLGTALLEYYRGLGRSGEPADVQVELPNVLGMMSWAESISRLPDRDVIRFTRHLREAFYRSSQWEVGLSWLRYSEEVGRRFSLFRSVGECAITRARLLLATGNATSALRAIEAARTAFDESAKHTESDLRLGIASEEKLQASLDYDALQRRWLTHLQIAARIALLPARPDMAQLEDLVQLVDEARSWLGATREGVAANAHIAATLAALLNLDAVQVELLMGDIGVRRADRARAAVRWRSAHRLLSKVRNSVNPRSGLPTGTQQELLAQIERMEGAIARRWTAQATGLGRLLWRMHGNRHLAKGLQYARTLRFEEALIRLESAELQVAGIASSAPFLLSRGRTTWRPAPLRRMMVQLLPQGRQLQIARRHLLVVQADAAALGAQALQFAALTALAGVAKHLAKLARNAADLRAAADSLRSAESIAQRLQREMPNLWTEVQTLSTRTSVAGAGSESTPARGEGQGQSGERMAIRR
jgi:hypothetical protein